VGRNRSRVAAGKSGSIESLCLPIDRPVSNSTEWRSSCPFPAGVCWSPNTAYAKRNLNNSRQWSEIGCEHFDPYLHMYGYYLTSVLKLCSLQHEYYR